MVSVGATLPRVAAVLCLALLFCWSYPYYLARLENHRKQLHIINTVCHRDHSFPEVQLNKVTHDGLSSNCTEAIVFIQTPVLLGTLNDMWEGSVIYTVIHASTWQLQLGWFLIMAVTVWVSIREYGRLQNTKQIMAASKNNNDKLLASVADTEGRRTVAFLKPPPKCDPVEVKQESSPASTESPQLVFKKIARTVLSQQSPTTTSVH